MWFDQSVPVLAVADTTRPILLIVFIVGLFALAALGVFFGRKHVASQNARALSDDTGLDKGAERGGDGTFSTDWIAEVREDVDDTPRQSWADVLSLQGISHAPDAAATSPFGSTETPMGAPVSYEAASVQAAPSYEVPAYPVDPETPAYPVESAAVAEAEMPVYETPAETVYEVPAYETPAETVYEVPAYETPAETVYEVPAYETPAEPVHHVPSPQITAVTPPAAPGEEYATFFGATPPPPPPPPVEPFNIWAPDPDER